MALSANEQVRYWGIAAVMSLFFLWMMGNILLPFITGMAIAYFLDPLVDRLEALGLSRRIATSVITLAVMVIILILLIVLIPLLVRQTVEFISALPEYVAQFRTFVGWRFPEAFQESSAVWQGLTSVIEFIRSKGGDLANALLVSAFTIVDMVIFLVVTPVVAFYLLLDWDRLIAIIDSWIPRDHLATVRNLARQIDSVLAGFVRGQMTVCGILGIFYGLALMLVGLQFGVVIGLIAGLLTFIPYVGSIIGGLLSIGLALFQFWDDPIWIGVVMVIFMIGQILEGNFLTPKLVGQSVGLHPVWLMLALSAFGGLLGFTGMLIAVPAAAMLGVFFRFGVGQYLGGRLYSGKLGEKDIADG